MRRIIIAALLLMPLSASAQVNIPGGLSVGGFSLGSGAGGGSGPTHYYMTNASGGFIQNASNGYIQIQ